MPKRPKRRSVLLLACLMCAALCVYGAFLAGQHTPLQEARAATQETLIQAESMSLTGSVVRVTSAGNEVVFYTNGTASASYSGSLSKVTLAARASSCATSPLAEVFVDGAKVGQTPITSQALQNYPVALSKASGTHQIQIEYQNDASSPCDVNLWLDKVTLTSADDACPTPSANTIIGAGDIATGGVGSTNDATAKLI
jgi:hypothetical protein